MKTRLPKMLLAALMGTFASNASALTIIDDVTKDATKEVLSDDIYISDDVEGRLTLTNGAEIDMSKAKTLAIGGDAYGELNLEKGSKLNGGYNNFWMYDGTVNVKDAGSELQLCTADPNASAAANYRILLGTGSGTTSSFNVTDGGKVISSAMIFASNFASNSTTNINVDGAGSKFIVTAETGNTGHYFVGNSGEWVYRENGVDGWFRADGWYDKDSTGEEWKFSTGHGKVVVYLADSGTDVDTKINRQKTRGAKVREVNNCTTNINVSNGGLVDFQNSLTFIGSFRDRELGYTNKSVNFNVGEGATVAFDRLEVYADTNITNAGRFLVNGGLSLHTGTTLTLNLTQFNKETPVITMGNNAEIKTTTTTATGYSAGGITIKITGSENMAAGTKFILINDDSLLADTNVSFTGTSVDVSSDGKNLILTLLEDIYVGFNPLADAVQASNWGVFKSSQAFVGTLFAPRTNAVVVESDGKGGIVPAEAMTLAWGTAYSSFSRQGGSGEFGGAEYSIYGAAVGVERQFASGRSVGVALGYDWGRVSPYNTARVDQDSWHVALYGRAAQWKVGQKGELAIDWSAAAGNTTSECDALGADWSQDSMQLDVRATYTRELTERTACSVFAGVQYYAQNDDSTSRVEADSLQNLRLMAGAGISHKLTSRATVYGEVSVYNDAMRHNPGVVLDGFTYGTGANPGRIGGDVTVGAQYGLSEQWTLRGSYSFEAAENNRVHNVNVGAVYSF